MIARGFREDGSYPNESKLSQAGQKAGAQLNHAEIKTDFDQATGTVTGVGQNASQDGSIQPEARNVAAEGWFVVRSKEPFDKKASEGVIQPAKVEDPKSSH